LILEIINPIIGVFHGSMLTIGILAGYVALYIIGKISARVVWRVYQIKNSDKIVIEYLPYSFVKKLT